MSIRLIASKHDPDARYLYRKFKRMGCCPVAVEGVILFLVTDAEETGDEYLITVHMKKRGERAREQATL